MCSVDATLLFQDLLPYSRRGDFVENAVVGLDRPFVHAKRFSVPYANAAPPEDCIVFLALPHRLRPLALVAHDELVFAVLHTRNIDVIRRLE